MLLGAEMVLSWLLFMTRVVTCWELTDGMVVKTLPLRSILVNASSEARPVIFGSAERALLVIDKMV